MANVYTAASISVEVTAIDSEGRTLGSARLTVPPLGHRAFVLQTLMPGLPDFAGTIVISAVDRPHDHFLAWTLYENDGLLSSLPPGPAAWPLSHSDRIWLVYSRVADAAIRLEVLDSIPELKILAEKVVNAYARGGTTVGVTLGLSQLISDSPSELAFALAHELGHIYQQRNDGLLEMHENPEFDADIWGVAIALVAGYDPYAAAGTLAKLSMATGRSGLATQFEDQLSEDAHKSFNARLESIFDTFVEACNSSEVAKRACAQYKDVVHPNLPPGAPLRESPRRR